MAEAATGQGTDCRLSTSHRLGDGSVGDVLEVAQDQDQALPFGQRRQRVAQLAQTAVGANRER